MENAQDYKKYILELIDNNEINKANEMIESYIEYNKFDLDIDIIKSYLMIIQGNLDDAEILLSEKYNKYELNYDINYGLAKVNHMKKKFNKYSEYILRCIHINPSKKDELMEELKNIKLEDLGTDEFNDINNLIKNKFINIPWIYPIKGDGSSYVGQDIYEKNEKKTMLGIYDYYYEARDGIHINHNVIGSTRMLKYERLNVTDSNHIALETKHDTVFPIMFKDKSALATIKIDDKSYKIDNLYKDRYYYYKINKSKNVKIDTSDGVIIGEPIELKIDEQKPKLVLNIFIDGLSQKIIEKNGLENIMPNTYDYFKSGTIFNNCYTTGDWTKPSLWSVFTGLHVHNHNITTAEYHYDRGYKEKTFIEVLKDNGFFTAKIDGDCVTLPPDGGVKGIDRYLYQLCARGMNSEEAILETIEHLEAFKEKNNFVWMGIPELHDIADGFELRLSNQIDLDIESRTEKINRNIPSVLLGYDERLVKKYESQVRRIDRNLNILFKYLNENYNDNEIIISLMSDHGQCYVEDSEYRLDDKTTKVPMMIKGLNISSNKSNEIVHNMDLFPAIFSKIGIVNYDIKDANVPNEFDGQYEREYSYTETIHKDRHYEVLINDHQHKFHLKSLDLSNLDGRFRFDEYDVNLINKETNEDETDKYLNKVEMYSQIVFDKIKDRIIY